MVAPLGVTAIGATCCPWDYYYYYYYYYYSTTVGFTANATNTDSR